MSAKCTRNDYLINARHVPIFEFFSSFIFLNDSFIAISFIIPYAQVFYLFLQVPEISLTIKSTHISTHTPTLASTRGRSIDDVLHYLTLSMFVFVLCGLFLARLYV